VLHITLKAVELTPLLNISSEFGQKFFFTKQLTMAYSYMG